MKKSANRNLFILLVLIFCTATVWGQETPDVDELFEEDTKFIQNFWFGGGMILGFSNFNNVSEFRIGISPMAGYKITDEFSIGPRISSQYIGIKDFGSTFRFTAWTFGALARYKLFPSIFAQVEYEYETTVQSKNNPTTYFFPKRDHFYLGGGYHSGLGIWGYEIVVLYDLVERTNVALPLTFRAGVTYNF